MDYSCNFIPPNLSIKTHQPGNINQAVSVKTICNCNIPFAVACLGGVSNYLTTTMSIPQVACGAGITYLVMSCCCDSFFKDNNVQIISSSQNRIITQPTRQNIHRT